MGNLETLTTRSSRGRIGPLDLLALVLRLEALLRPSPLRNENGTYVSSGKGREIRGVGGGEG